MAAATKCDVRSGFERVTFRILTKIVLSSRNMRDLFRVEPQFFDRADECRRHFDQLVGNPYSNLINREVWDYWYVPNQYTYIRTTPTRIFPQELYDAFMKRLRAWAFETLGTPY